MKTSDGSDSIGSSGVGQYNPTSMSSSYDRTNVKFNSFKGTGLHFMVQDKSKSKSSKKKHKRKYEESSSDSESSDSEEKPAKKAKKSKKSKKKKQESSSDEDEEETQQKSGEVLDILGIDASGSTQPTVAATSSNNTGLLFDDIPAPTQAPAPVAGLRQPPRKANDSIFEAQPSQPVQNSNNLFDVFGVNNNPAPPQNNDLSKYLSQIIKYRRCIFRYVNHPTIRIPNSRTNNAPDVNRFQAAATAISAKQYSKHQ